MTYELLVNLGLPFLVIVFLLEGALFGKLLPTDFILPAAVVLYATQTQHYFSLIALTAISSTAGQYWLFKQIGKKDKEDVLNHRYIKISDDKLDRAEEKFQEHGLKAVLVSNMVPGIRGFLTIPAALNRADPMKFTLLSATGTMVYHTVLVGVGIGLISIF